jgi:hypothetical protein
MSKIRGFAAAAAAGVAVVTLMSSLTAEAAPKGGDLGVDLACGGDVGNIQVVFTPTPDNEVANENAKNFWTPGFIVGTNDVFIPYDVNVTFSFGTEAFTFAETKPAPLPGSAITCDVSLTPGTATEDLTITGTVTGVIR